MRSFYIVIETVTKSTQSLKIQALFYSPQKLVPSFLQVQEFGVTDVRDLIPHGRNLPVTEENKMEYIRLVCQMKMTGAIRKQ